MWRVRGFPGGATGKESAYNAGDVGDVGLIPGSGRSSGGGPGNSIQYSGWENPMDRGAWWATVYRVTQSQIQLKPLSMHAITLECSLSTKVTPRVWQNGGLVWGMLRYPSRWFPFTGYWQEGSQMATTNRKGRWLRRKRIRCGIRQQSSPVQSGQTRIETQVCLPPESIFLFAALFSVPDVSSPSAPI